MEEEKVEVTEVTKKTKNTFDIFYELDVRDKVEQKNGLNYLSWAYAWAEVKKIDEHAEYNILRFENNLPYVYDEKTGYMVFTEMDILGIKHSMFLPVMDGANKTMLDHPYTYQVKEYKDGKWTGDYVEKDVEAATMFDINKTLMRCLVKNIAMFGLGLNLYQGEDLPAVATKEEAEKVVITFGKHNGKTLKELYENERRYFEWLRENTKDENIKVAIDLISPTISEEEEQEILTYMAEINTLVALTGADFDKILKHYEVKTTADMTLEQLKDCKATLEKKKEKEGK
jgi:predicted nuclease of restriction endonuclease-like RecB superfamily